MTNLDPKTTSRKQAQAVAYQQAVGHYALAIQHLQTGAALLAASGQGGDDRYGSLESVQGEDVAADVLGALTEDHYACVTNVSRNFAHREILEVLRKAAKTLGSVSCSRRGYRLSMLGNLSKNLIHALPNMKILRIAIYGNPEVD